MAKNGYIVFRSPRIVGRTEYLRQEREIRAVQQERICREIRARDIKKIMGKGKAGR